MKKEKQLIERNLKFSDLYQYNGIIRGSIESGQTSCCDNCGKLITNMVQIINRTSKKHLSIGIDCADTLVKAKCMTNGISGCDVLDYNFDVYCFNKCLKVVTEINKGKNVHVDMIYVRMENDKGKLVECSKSDLQKYFPEIKL